MIPKSSVPSSRPFLVRFLAFSATALLTALAGCGEPAASTTTTSSGSGGEMSTGTSMVSSGSGGSAGSGGSGAGGPWRSSLYPEDWTPAFEDAESRFLHDFSYAGFRYGEEPAAAAALPSFDAVADYGADPTGAVDATLAVQTAIDDAAVAGGGIVVLGEGLFRFEGVLHVAASNTVLRGKGPSQTRLYFTRTEGMSDTSHILFDAPLTSDLETLLVTDGAPRATVVEVADASGFAPGDDIAVGFTITPEFIEEHAMTGTWQAFNGSWEPFFWRTVVAVDTASSPNTLTVDVPLRYPTKLRDGASVRREKGYLTGCGVESLGIANAASWDEAWSVARTHAIEIAHAADGFIRDVRSFPSPNAPATGAGAGAHLLSGGILVRESKRITVDHVELALAQNRGGGGNGYLFEIQRSGEVLIADSKGTAGRHNFIQNWGFGTTGCVLLRVESREGKSLVTKDDSFTVTSLSEYHHSLATANLVDSSLFDDGFSTINRHEESTGAGHTGTQNAFWNLRGKGMLRSLQFGWGYVIGTSGLALVTESPLPMATGTEPFDLVEGQDRGATVEPPSLYEDQRKRRLQAR
jgi:hypothetical protein